MSASAVMDLIEQVKEAAPGVVVPVELLENPADYCRTGVMAQGMERP
ncbi:Uncharacterized protein yubF [Salmonella enterica subsp. arizonae]|uniref:Uncharacterized protein yubF n=1 Tax=Salmonella enterica subsp. arizonae TaxID=59203 RepID=A0A379T2R1_SALER|nr:Uncharacterized protein yubF [Salmonella enterica subsp. arizonae]